MAAETMARMLADDAASASQRKAALLLHSMADADRRWMLRQVDAVQRRRLSELLEELEKLDFPRDPSLLREALRTSPIEAASPAPERRGLSRWSVDDALRVFEGEPDALIAVALSGAERSQPWSWEPAFLRRLGQERGLKIAACRDLLATKPPAPALVEAVLEAAVARMALAEGGAAGSLT